jgi:hypothetical protein
MAKPDLLIVDGPPKAGSSFANCAASSLKHGARRSQANSPCSS